MAPVLGRLSKSCIGIIIVITLGFSSMVSAKWVKSSIDTNDDWIFITRFCFLSEHGRFHYVFRYPKSYGIQQLLLYYDAPGQWESVYKSSKNCSTRQSILSKVNNQIIDLTNEDTDSRDAGCSVYNQDGEDYYNCTDEVTFKAMRERWWYIVLARCGPSVGGLRGLKLDYQIHMMNGPPGDFLHHELSADEFYILPVDIAFLLTFIVLLILSIICSVILSKRQMFHTTYKMYITALCLWIFGLFLQCIAWGRYGETGWEESRTEVTGRLFLAASTAVFLLMLLLMAKGYTITRGRLTQMSAVRLTIFFCLYIIVNITLFIWEGAFFDEGYVLYFYESPPGYGLVAMRIVAWLWFLYAFAFTMKHHPNKAKFYIPFFIFYSLWFWAGPIVILVAINGIAKWSRQKTVNGVEQFVALLGYLFFLVRFSDDETEPAERYGVSEESRQHLDSIFTIQGSGASRPPSHPPSYSTATDGQRNRDHDGYMKAGNGYTSALDTTFTTQPNGNIRPQGAQQPLPPISPPSYNEHQHPPGYENVTTQSPLQGDGPQLPPLQEAGQPLPQNGRGALSLPPLHSGLLPPIRQPSAPAE